jgi:hypothetical protein
MADDFLTSSLNNLYKENPIFNEGFGINSICIDCPAPCNSCDILPNFKDATGNDPNHTELLTSHPSDAPWKEYLELLFKNLLTPAISPFCPQLS